MTFATDKDGGLDLTNDFTMSNGATGHFDERYRLDAATGRWSWTSTFPGDSSETGTAAPWTGADWVFEGTLTATSQPPSGSIEPAGTASRPVHMIYTYVDADTFHRQFEVQTGGQWHRTSASTCRRAAAP